MRLAFSIAVRFLRFGKLQTLFIILGIAVGVSVQVFIGSLISGLQISLVDKTIGSSSQVTIAPVEKGNYLDEYENKIMTIKQNNSIITVITPTVNTSGNLIKGDLSESVLLRGFNLDEANDIYKFNDKVIEGRLPVGDYEVMIGRNIKENLNINLGESIEIAVPLKGTKQFKVVGFFDFNVASVNKSWVVANLSTVQHVLSIDQQISSIEMQISEVFDAEQVSLEIESILNDSNIQVDNWIEANEELLSGLQGQSISSVMIQVFVMISVVLGIASVLAITVLQKSKQIGILKAMGINNRDASLVFLFEGIILGLFGAIFGILFGLGLSLMFTTFAVTSDGNPVVPLYIDYSFIALSGVIAVLASSFASLIPAIKSSKLSVIEVIRNA